MSRINYRRICAFTAVIVLIIAFISVAIMLPSTAKAEEKYSDGIIAKGMDVSVWQDEIDWEKVVESGIDFAIVRAGFSGEMDNRFEENYIGAKSVGLNLGAYIYTYAESVKEAQQDAEDCTEWLKGKTFEYPIYFDIEAAEQKDNSKAKNTEITLAFLDRLSGYGYLCGVYSSAYWYSALLDFDKISEKYETWVAHWIDDTHNDIHGYSKIHGMWQYRSNGSVYGINGNVDMDVCYKKYPSIIKNEGYNGYSISTDTDSDLNTESGITFNNLVYGDVTLDGKLKMNDVTTAQSSIAGKIELSKWAKKAADVDIDGKVTLRDVVLLQRRIAGYTEVFPAE